MSIDTSQLPEEVICALKQYPDFEPLECNTSGANGYVLIGKHNILGTNVAIKIYYHEADEIDQEPTYISKITHDNVLRVHDARKIDTNCSCFLTSAANYGDLAKYLADYNVSLPLAHALLCQLLSGISALHGKPNLLVHRDLKPENLLIHDDKIVIADFGSVRRINETTQKAPASRHSVLYRPLEAFGPEPFYNFSSDVYQAGLIGFLLFGGKLSNDLTTYMTRAEKSHLSTISDVVEQSRFVDSCIYNRIRAKKLINWDSLPFYIPGNIKKILKTATSTIGKRYTNVSDFLRELSHVKYNMPDWIVNNEGYELRNWNGAYYFIRSEDNTLLKKKKSKDYRVDNQFSGESPSAIFEQLKARIGLP
ncbi:protein kinase family protein [Fundidesulfovibrio agrisoli]|uniref:protein kinase family protein n=1 Tax=Fundidesulfovibrio agrisoli TaxID=2922717 RepID=UPI001FAD456F|nr:protein kinase family protein [Fundidesulfovibrio agrisoli]